MSRPPGKPPALMRARAKHGGHIGSYFMWLAIPGEKNPSGGQKYKRVNLATKDFEKAKVRRGDAMATGKTDFLYDDDETAVAAPRPPDPAPVIPVVPAPVMSQLAAAEYHPIVLPAEPAPLDQRPADPPPSNGVAETPATDWTVDAARAAGATDAPGATTEPAPATTAAPAPETPPDDGKVRIKDIAIMKSVFVTASRIAVQLQIAFHVLVARYLFKLELDPIRDENIPKDVAGFMAAQGQPWPDTDPREAGRQMWEQFGKRVCPDDLVLPDWVLAPALVAVQVLPIQIQHAKPLAPKPKPGVPVLPSVTAATVSAPPDPNPTNDPRVREPSTTPVEPARKSPHIPVMMDVS
jgi:hypothetical protein